MERIKFKKRLKAFTLTEIVIVLALVSIVVYSLASFTSDSIRFEENRWKGIQATLKVNEITNAIGIVKNDLWQNIIDNTNDGAKYLQYNGSTYQIVDGTEVTADGINLDFQIGDVFRDGSGNIVTSGGTLDIGSRVINLTAAWTDSFGFANDLNSEMAFFANSIICSSSLKRFLESELILIWCFFEQINEYPSIIWLISGITKKFSVSATIFARLLYSLQRIQSCQYPSIIPRMSLPILTYPILGTFYINNV